MRHVRSRHVRHADSQLAARRALCAYVGKDRSDTLVTEAPSATIEETTVISMNSTRTT